MGYEYWGDLGKYDISFGYLRLFGEKGNNDKRNR